MRTFEIGKDVYQALTGMQRVGQKVFPLVAEEGTTFPFLVYRRSNVSSEYVKDGCIQDEVTLEVTAVNDTYFPTLSIAEEVRGRVEAMTSTNGVHYADIQLTNATEDFADNAYTQTLTFSITVTNN